MAASSETGSETQHAVFHGSIASIFERWTALQLAVNLGYGGRYSKEKALWMVDAVYNWFQENDDIEPDELESFIAEIMDNEFDTRLEDGSLIAMSLSICSYFDLCKTGRQAEVLQKIRDMPKADLGACKSVEMEDESDGDRPPSEHNMMAMMGNMQVGASENGEPTPIQFPERSEEQLSSTETQPAQTEDYGWTVVTKTKKK